MNNNQGHDCIEKTGKTARIGISKNTLKTFLRSDLVVGPKPHIENATSATAGATWATKGGHSCTKLAVLKWTNITREKGVQDA